MTDICASKPEPINHISVVIITRDAANTIKETLLGLCRFSDVVIYDNGSQDNTVELATKFPNVTVITGEFLGFGPTKRKATEYASNGWIFSLDADEIPSTELIDRLATWPIGDDPHCVGVVLRENYLMGKRIARGGWGNDWLVRIFHRATYNFNDAPVHEKVEIDEKARQFRLAEPIAHQAVNDLSQFLDKINRYSDIRSAAPRRHYSPTVIFLKAIFAFLRSYVLRGGFLCGWRGLVIAVANSNGVFWKYIKAHARREAEQEASNDT